MSRENQAVEWKESWRDEYLRHVCGFANAGGGLLVIENNDSGKVVGVTDAARLLEELPNKIRDLSGAEGNCSGSLSVATSRTHVGFRTASGAESIRSIIRKHRQFREQAAASGRLSPTDLVSSDAGMLEKLKLAEGDYLKRAAVLLFHKTLDRFITGAFVKIGFFVSESELGYHDEIHGPLFTQANTVIDLLQRIGSQGLRCSRRSRFACTRTR